MKQALWLAAALGWLAVPAAGQTPTFLVTGKVIEAADASPLPGVHAVLYPAGDSTRPTGVLSDADGQFRLTVARPGTYVLHVSFVGFSPHEDTVRITRPRTRIGTIRLREKTLDLSEIVVEEVQERVRLRKDTTEYNADAYRVNPDADVEDLIAKMPGVVVADGEVQVLGEDVQRVLIDGEEFFGDDAMLALRNLPADIVERIQVYDRGSEEARFSGFEDGNTEKTINIITRPGRSRGQFGRLYGGLGSDAHYRTGAALNAFQGRRRITLLAMSNDVNEQNFGTEDLLGEVETSSRRRSGGLDVRNFLVGRQIGLSTTHALGLNYTDRLGRRLQLNGSYFFNQSDNINHTDLDREYVLGRRSSQRYAETSDAAAENLNHRFSGRLQFRIDSSHTVQFIPQFSYQSNTSLSRLLGTNRMPAGDPLNRTFTDNLNDNAGYSAAARLIFQRRFARPGRTVSVSAAAALRDRTGGRDQFATRLRFDDEPPLDSTLLYDQQINNDVEGVSYSGRVQYTEPLGAGGQLELSYSPSYSESRSDRRAYGPDPATLLYTRLDTAYSNLFDNRSVAQRGGLGYRKRGDRYVLTTELEYQNERLLGDRMFPSPFAVDRTFHSLLPSATLRLDFSERRNLRAVFRSATDTPSIAQLQDVVDNRNPLHLVSGNPGLRPGYTRVLYIRYGGAAPEKGRMVSVFLSGSQTSRYTGNSSVLAAADTVLEGTIALPAGARFTRPVNLDGYWNLRFAVSMGMPPAALRSNLNLNAGAAYRRLPGLVNGIRDATRIASLTGRATLGSNISERLDFTLAYAAEYADSRNASFSDLNRRYVRHEAQGRLNWRPAAGIVLETRLHARAYAGLDNDLYPPVAIWNAGIGYTFLPGRAAEVKLSVYDILQQDNDLNRRVTEFFIEDRRSDVLGRYALLTLSYRLRHFAASPGRR